MKGSLEPYEPFGVLYGAFCTNLINYEAVLNAVPHLIAMSFIYTLRWYLFASAFRKSAAGAWEYIHQKESAAALSSYSQSIHLGSTNSVNPGGRHHRRQSSLGTTQAGVLEEISLFHLQDNAANIGLDNELKKVPSPKISKTLSWCNATLMLLASIGTGGGVIPGIGISPSLLKVGSSIELVMNVATFLFLSLSYPSHLYPYNHSDRSRRPCTATYFNPSAGIFLRYGHVYDCIHTENCLFMPSSPFIYEYFKYMVCQLIFQDETKRGVVGGPTYHRILFHV